MLNRSSHISVVVILIYDTSAPQLLRHIDPTNNTGQVHAKDQQTPLYKTFGGVRRALDFFWADFCSLFFFEKSRQSTQIHIYSHLDLNSVSSSNEKLTHLGPIPSSWRIPVLRVHLRRGLKLLGKHFSERETSGCQFV